jgi:AcrR family transcriptional regulator
MSENYQLKSYLSSCMFNSMASTTKTSRAFDLGAKDRRVRKSQHALRESFIALVLERGYDSVTIEDIAERADVARATFYAHFEDKEQLLTSLFEELTEELALRLTVVEGAPETIRTYIVMELYAQAAEFRDLYLVCLRGAGNGRARAAYVDIIASRAEVVFAERLRAAGHEPGVPLSVLARAFAGAHVTLLQDWLEAGDMSSVESAVNLQMTLLTNGYAWALGMLPKEYAFPEGLVLGPE